MTGGVPGRFGDPADRPGYYHGTDLLRLVAMTAVVYTHIANWFATRGRQWTVGEVIDAALITPLHLNAHLSFVGVSGFLLISGLVVTHVALRETPGLFLGRRAVRVLPAMVVMAIVVWVLRNTALVPPTGAPSVLDLLANVSFVAFFGDSRSVLLGVAWTLLVQIVFYCYVAATIPLLRRHPWLPVLLGSTLCAVVLAAVPSVDPATQRIGIIATYLPVLLIGQVIALVRAGRIGPAPGVALVTGNLLLFSGGDRLGVYTGTAVAHTRTLVLVVAVVALAMSVRNRVTTSAAVRVAATRTYAVFLVHETCVYPLLDLLVPRVGSILALWIVLVCVVAAAELLYRLVERPTAELLRPGRRPAPV